MLYCSSVCALSVLCDKLFTVARYARFEKKKPLKLSACRAYSKSVTNCAAGACRGGKQQTQMYRKAVHMKQTVARLSEGESHITSLKESRE